MEYHFVCHVNAGIVIRIDINVDLSQLMGFMEVGSKYINSVESGDFGGLRPLHY